MIALERYYHRILGNLNKINLLKQTCEQIGWLNSSYWNIMRESLRYPFYSYESKQYDKKIDALGIDKYNLLMSISISDYTELFTFNENDFARFPLANPMNMSINDNTNTENKSTLGNITYGIINATINPATRMHARTQPIMSMRAVILQNIFTILNDYMNHDERTLIIHDYNHVIDYANDIMQGYPVEFALEKLKMNAYYDDDNKNSNSDNNSSESETMTGIYKKQSGNGNHVKRLQLMHDMMKHGYADMLSSDFIHGIQVLKWIITHE